MSSDEEYYYCSDNNDDDNDDNTFYGSESKNDSEQTKQIAQNQHYGMQIRGYTVMNKESLRGMLDKIVKEVSSVLAIPNEYTMILLRYFKWDKNRLFDQFYSDSELLKEKAGIKNYDNNPQLLSKNTIGECRICCEEHPNESLFALGCGHFFCFDCWEQYLTNKLSEGGICVITTCPQHKCTEIVPETVFKRFLSSESMNVYERFLLDTFVESNPLMRWCPNPKCNEIIVGSGGLKSIQCLACSTVFCFRCGEDCHAPASCEELKLWLEKCQNESETANWILANTKKCPRCTIRIEKNQGCNHMTCRQCKYEFCWICMGSWIEHGASTGGYYKCHKYDPSYTPESGGESNAEKAKRELDRYLHYYQRYHNHHLAQKFAEKQQLNVEEKMIQYQKSKKSVSWIDVQFLKDAVDQLIACRRVLKFTYVFGYYLPDGTPEKNLFEHHQQNLEKFTEQLSELSETPIESMLSADISNFTHVTQRFMTNLLKSCEDGLVQDHLGQDEGKDTLH